LIVALPKTQLWGRADVEVSGIAYNSRLVQPGDLFVAIRGLTTDGHLYIPEAIERGAVAIVGEREPETPPRVPFIVVSDSRQAIALLSAAFYGFPARSLRVIGVTGTEGKTTTVNLIHAILVASGRRAGLVSTVRAVIGGVAYDTGLHTTTPEAPDVQRYLAQMVAAGAEYAVLEATSHGLDQHRVAGCEFDVAVLTNITHDHLDYHKSLENYRKAKARLFRYLSSSYRKPDTPKVSILNADDPSFAYLRGIPADVHMSYGLNSPADVIAKEIIHSISSTEFVIQTPQGDFPVTTPLIGTFNVYNILAAVAVGISQGIPFEAMQKAINSFKGIEGRMERVDMGQDFIAIVDFAHTPNALRQALATAREMSSGRVIVVFGCPGLRDKSNRPMMGEIAGRMADLIVLTADDPRIEDVNEIISQIAAGCEKAGRREGVDYWRIPDRREAIDFAVRMARPGDLVLAAGKGHERSLAVGTQELPWDERAVVEEALKRHL